MESFKSVKRSIYLYSTGNKFGFKHDVLVVTFADVVFLSDIINCSVLVLSKDDNEEYAETWANRVQEKTLAYNESSWIY